MLFQSIKIESSFFPPFIFVLKNQSGECVRPPDLSIFVKKKKFFLIFSTELFCFLWGLVMKTQCANPNIKSMLYNEPPPSQPSPERQISVRTFGNWSTRNSSVHKKGLLIMSLSIWGEAWGFPCWHPHFRKSKSLEICLLNQEGIVPLGKFSRLG